MLDQAQYVIGSGRRRIARIALPLLAIAALLAVAPTAGAAASIAPSRVLSAWAPAFDGAPGTAPTVMVGANPLGDLADPATHTLYVANSGGTTVSVVNTAHCTGVNASGCGKPVATVNAGPSPFGFALDPANHTLYVTDAGSDTVAMLDTSTCNATDTAGCGTAPLMAQAGNFPAFPGFDQATDTLYVPNVTDGTVSVVDAATCNAATTAGCGQTATVTAGTGPTEAAVDDQTHTVFVANSENATGGQTPPGTIGIMSMIDTATCSGLHMACSTPPATVPADPETSGLVVDQASDTVYVQDGPAGDGSLGSVAMIDGRTCNAATTASCTPRFTPGGSGPIWITENQATRTVYAVNQEDMDISVIDARTCNATNAVGCHTVPPALGIGGRSSVTPDFNDDGGAGAVAVDPTTDSLYATSMSEDNVTVLDGAACNAFNTSGCTPFAPTTTVGNGPQAIATDPATHTAYVANQVDGTVSVIDTRACNLERRAGCGGSWPTVTVGTFPQAIAIDLASDTVYVANAGSNSDASTTVSVIDGATCNASDHFGCGNAPHTITVGNAPNALAVDPHTHTVYVANGANSTVSVIDGAACSSPAGCKPPVATVPVGTGPQGLAVDTTTDTVYVANGGDNTVSVIDAATCNALTQAGCGQTRAAVPVGAVPQQLAIDPTTHTAYVVDLIGNALSVINTTTCNAEVIGGCSTPAPEVPLEGIPWGIAIDRFDDEIYLSSVWDSDVATINANTCNATNIHGCDPHPIPIRMGGWPQSIALDPATATGYVTDNVDGTTSVFALGSSW